jgi:hypothetical protein
VGAHAYWRVRGITKQAAGNGSLAYATVEMRATPGGSNLCSGGTPSAGSTFSTFVAANAFDGNSATVWSGDNGAGIPAQWIAYHFASPVAVNEIYVLIAGALNGTFISQIVESSDDGVLWAAEWQHTAMVDWVINEARTFTRPVAGATVASWRLYCQAAADGGAYVGAAEFEMRATAGGSDQCSGGTVIFSSQFDATVGGSGYAAVNAFDNSNATRWASAAGLPAWIGYTFASPVAVAEVSITAQAGALEYPQTPAKFIIQSASDAKTWVDCASYSAISWTSGNQQRLFATPVVPDYYTLNATKAQSYAATGLDQDLISAPKAVSYGAIGNPLTMLSTKAVSYGSLGPPQDLTCTKAVSYGVLQYVYVPSTQRIRVAFVSRR